MELTQIRRNVKQFGTVKTVEDVALRALNSGVFFKILKGLKIDTVQPEFMHCDSKYRGLFLSESMLAEYAGNPQYEISRSFLEQALAKGDECYGFLHGDVLASYGWYSNKPTTIEPPDLVLHFHDQYIYMYKGFTHVNYRGQRLHAVGMTRALDAYLARGYKGIVSYVEWNNFGSLKSCYRMGYQDFGNIYAARLFNRYVLRSGEGCQRYGFGLEWVRPGARQMAAAG
jgi:hypothetical protein